MFVAVTVRLGVTGRLAGGQLYHCNVGGGSLFRGPSHIYKFYILHLPPCVFEQS